LVCTAPRIGEDHKGETSKPRSTDREEGTSATMDAKGPEAITREVLDTVSSGSVVEAEGGVAGAWGDACVTGGTPRSSSSSMESQTSTSAPAGAEREPPVELSTALGLLAW